MTLLNAEQQPQSTLAELTAIEAVALCTSLETSMDVLIDLIETECDLVRQGKLSAAAEVQETKASCARAYIEAFKQARTSAQSLQQFAPEAVDKLRRRHREFQSLLQLNMAALMTAKAVSENLVRTVADSVGTPARPETYGAGGILSDAKTSHRGLSVNQSA